MTIHEYSKDVILTLLYKNKAIAKAQTSSSDGYYVLNPHFGVRGNNSSTLKHDDFDNVTRYVLFN